LYIKWNPKGETLDKVKARLIALCPTHHTVFMSRFYTVLESLAKHNLPGWAVGKTPRERAELLREFFCMHNGDVAESDYTSMDALISEMIRTEISDPLALSPFEESDLLEEFRLRLDLEKSVFMSARSPGGKQIWGDSAGCNISGSRAVGFVNTSVNYVLAKYAEWLKTLRDAKLRFKLTEFTSGAFFESPAARDILRDLLARPTCVVGGDDGAVASSVVPDLVQLTTSLGMKIKIAQPRDGRLTFFSRVYTNLPSHLASYPCIDRALGKLATSRMGDAGFGAKWLGSLAADAENPLLRAYVNALKRVYPEEMKFDQSDKEYQIKVKEGAHPDIGEHADELISFMAVDLGVPTAWVRDAIAAYERAKKPEDVAAVRLRVEPRAMKFPAAWV